MWCTNLCLWHHFIVLTNLCKTPKSSPFHCCHAMEEISVGMLWPYIVQVTYGQVHNGALAIAGFYDYACLQHRNWPLLMHVFSSHDNTLSSWSSFPFHTCYKLWPSFLVWLQSLVLNVARFMNHFPYQQRGWRRIRTMCILWFGHARKTCGKVSFLILHLVCEYAHLLGAWEPLQQLFKYNTKLSSGLNHMASNNSQSF